LPLPKTVGNAYSYRNTLRIDPETPSGKLMERINLAGIHVLLVEDDDDALGILGGYLHHLGALVTLARNGTEAFRCLKQARADVIVTDLSMPGMGGIEFLSRLHDDPGEATHPTPVIAITAFSETFGGPQLAEEAGFRACLVKPVSPIRLATKVRQVFDHMNLPESKS
jgi:CheY-like chemotaxis protein